MAPPCPRGSVTQGQRRWTPSPMSTTTPVARSFSRSRGSQAARTRSRTAFTMDGSSRPESRSATAATPHPRPTSTACPGTATPQPAHLRAHRPNHLRLVAGDHDPLCLARAEARADQQEHVQTPRRREDQQSGHRARVHLWRGLRGYNIATREPSRNLSNSGTQENTVDPGDARSRPYGSSGLLGGPGRERQHESGRVLCVAVDLMRDRTPDR